MRPKFSFGAVFFSIAVALVCMASSKSFAQVSELTPYDSISGNNVDEISVSLDDETVVKNATMPLKDSLSKPHLQKPKEETEEQDSILSFNFLYYIIQKFKLSDIID